MGPWSLWGQAACQASAETAYGAVLPPPLAGGVGDTAPSSHTSPRSPGPGKGLEVLLHPGQEDRYHPRVPLIWRLRKLKRLEMKWDLAVPGPLPVTWGPSRHSLRLALRSQSSEFQEGISDS